MREGIILAIDQGTTGTTILLVDHEGTVRGRGYSELTQRFPRPGWVEHDPREIWTISMDVVATTLDRCGLHPRDLKAIGITNQRETTVLWDRATGEPVANAIVWQDRRTATMCDVLKDNGLNDVFRRKTGLVIDPYFSGTKVQWMLERIPGLRERATRGEIAFGTIDSWLVWNLTGGKMHITDFSNASRTLLYNIHDLRWDQEILHHLDIPSSVLPDVTPSSTLHGCTNPDVFFGQSIPIGGIAGDQQAALFGQACYGQGLAKNTYGTGSFLLLNTGPEAVQSHEGLLTTIAWGIENEPVEYALEGAIFVTGAAIQWLRDGIQIVEDASQTEALARSLEYKEGVYLFAALVGVGAPHWDPYARGTILGITRGTTRAHIVRATLESMAFQTLDVVQAMERESGITLRELRADGGAVVNGFLMQFQADILNAPIEVPLVGDTTALGAAYLAGLAVGFWDSRGEIDSKWKPLHRYVPQMDNIERARLHRQWLKAVDRARSWVEEDAGVPEDSRSESGAPP